MSPETLLQKFDVMAEAPNGVQKLRELILQLAVRGKLVPQDPNDEPASVLLEQIPAEKQRLYKGKAKQPDGLAPVSQDVAPFEVPDRWTWVRIGEAMDLINGRAFKPTEWSTTGIPIVRIQNLNNADAPFNYCNFEIPDKFYIDTEDLLLSWSGTPGTSFGAFVWRRGRAVLNQHIFRCDLYGNAYTNDFARLAINGRLEEMIAQAHGGVGLQHVTKEKLEKLAIVLPPLPEQRRIVAKVDELMALSDELEAWQQRRAQARAHLNRSALHHLTAVNDDAGLAEHWHRLHENFDLLYDTPEMVAELRQAVLQLAVRGKLVPQDPCDEPASVLLERIAREKQHLHRQGQIHNLKSLPPLSRDELTFEVPDGWEWVRLGSFGEFLGGGTPSKSDSTLWDGSIPWVTPKDMKLSQIRTTTDYVAEAALTRSAVRLIRAGAILIVVRGMILARTFPVAVAAQEVTVNQDMKGIVLHEQRTEKYLLLALKALEPIVLKRVERSTHGTCRLESSAIQKLCIPLPPLPEQRRIVAKVDELMALCDDLEARLTSAREKASHLAASVVHHAVAA